MKPEPLVLVVAATARELTPGHDWPTLQCGVGPVDAAASVAAAIAVRPPAAILHVGIAGARRRCALPPCAVIIGTEARYSDLAVPEEWAPSVLLPPDALVQAAHRELPDALLMPVATTASVAASTVCDIEAMEGFGVLRAAQLAGVPALEVRVIANEIEETDRARWHFDEAFATVAAITPRLVAALRAAVTT